LTAGVCMCNIWGWVALGLCCWYWGPENQHLLCWRRHVTACYQVCAAHIQYSHFSTTV